MRSNRVPVAVILLLLAIGGIVAAWSSYESSNEGLSQPDVALPQIGDSSSVAEIRDLQYIANQEDISLQVAIARYAWNDNFSIALDQIRSASPGSFANGEIINGSNAWVGFAGSVPQAARAIIDTFARNHSNVSIEVRTNLGFTEVELRNAIEAVHYAMLQVTEVSDALTSFESAASQIRAVVVLDNTTSSSILSGLQTIATNSLTDATRPDILNSLTVSVTRSNWHTTGGFDSSFAHLGGEELGNCTSGFTTLYAGTRGISTAGHCSNSLSDDGVSLAFRAEHEGTHGDFQWHTGYQQERDDFYGGSASSTEVDRRDVSSVGAPTKGQWLCRNGKTTHKNCQQVRRVNLCAGSVCNLVQMGSRQSSGGDSGGPVYLGFTAYGIHTGYVYDPWWPFSRDVFSRADRIDDALGISIATY